MPVTGLGSSPGPGEAGRGEPRAHVVIVDHIGRIIVIDEVVAARWGIRYQSRHGQQKRDQEFGLSKGQGRIASGERVLQLDIRYPYIAIFYLATGHGDPRHQPLTPLPPAHYRT